MTPQGGAAPDGTMASGATGGTMASGATGGTMASSATGGAAATNGANGTKAPDRCPPLPSQGTPEFGSRACDFVSDKAACKAAYEKGLACSGSECQQEATALGMAAFETGVVAAITLQKGGSEERVQAAVDAVATAVAYGEGVSESPLAKAALQELHPACPDDGSGPMDPALAARWSEAALRASAPVMAVVGGAVERQIDAVPCEPAKEAAKQLKQSLVDTLSPEQLAAAAESCRNERRLESRVAELESRVAAQAETHGQEIAKQKKKHAREVEKARREGEKQAKKEAAEKESSAGSCTVS